MAIAEPAGLSGDYADLFRACLARSAEQSRARISQAEGSLESQDLAQALHTLSYALKVDRALAGGPRFGADAGAENGARRLARGVAGSSRTRR